MIDNVSNYRSKKHLQVPLVGSHEHVTLNKKKVSTCEIVFKLYFPLSRTLKHGQEDLKHILYLQILKPINSRNSEKNTCSIVQLRIQLIIKFAERSLVSPQ